MTSGVLNVGSFGILGVGFGRSPGLSLTGGLGVGLEIGLVVGLGVGLVVGFKVGLGVGLKDGLDGGLGVDLMDFLGFTVGFCGLEMGVGLWMKSPPEVGVRDPRGTLV